MYLWIVVWIYFVYAYEYCGEPVSNGYCFYIANDSKQKHHALQHISFPKEHNVTHCQQQPNIADTVFQLHVFGCKCFGEFPQFVQIGCLQPERVFLCLLRWRSVVVRIAPCHTCTVLPATPGTACIRPRNDGWRQFFCVVLAVVALAAPICGLQYRVISHFTIPVSERRSSLR